LTHGFQLSGKIVAFAPQLVSQDALIDDRIVRTSRNQHVQVAEVGHAFDAVDFVIAFKFVPHSCNHG
jgi:hypothetical protein